MLDPGSNRELPPIPAKRYFTIGEVSELCDVKPHVLRYWETEFPSLKPVKRRGNRRGAIYRSDRLVAEAVELVEEKLDVGRNVVSDEDDFGLGLARVRHIRGTLSARSSE